ncbi:hypothetical protein ACOSP7_024765 [Xanthoceras sorbifolium]
MHLGVSSWVLDLHTPSQVITIFGHRCLGCLAEIDGVLHTEETEQVLVWEDSDRIDPNHTLPVSSPVGRVAVYEVNDAEIWVFRSLGTFSSSGKTTFSPTFFLFFLFFPSPKLGVYKVLHCYMSIVIEFGLLPYVLSLYTCSLCGIDEKKPHNIRAYKSCIVIFHHYHMCIQSHVLLLADPFKIIFGCIALQIS